MLGLSSLSGWEEAVLASVVGATGTLEERDAQIERSGLYGEYPAIVSAYIEHFSDADSTLEALKRAYFLVWRGAMAPPAESGIASLPDGTIRVVIDELDAWARRGATDAELRWMLGHYHAVGPSVLELYGASAAADSPRRRHRRGRLARGGARTGPDVGSRPARAILDGPGRARLMRPLWPFRLPARHASL